MIYMLRAKVKQQIHSKPNKRKEDSASSSLYWESQNDQWWNHDKNRAKNPPSIHRKLLKSNYIIIKFIIFIENACA